MRQIGVLGAGVMGRGVAQSIAESGHEVILLDLSEEILQQAMIEIKNNARLHQLFNKSITKTPEEICNLIHPTINLNRIKDVKFIIENISENIDKKRSLYYELDLLCSPDCIFMVNTSCISITKIASFLKQQDKVIGTHFMNPVPMMKAVEVIKGYHTSEETVKSVKDLLETMGKESIVVNDLPGFVSNRISHLMMNEAAFIVQDQVAEPKIVDEIFKKCYGHKMGPLETADLIGLDTVVNSLDVLFQSYNDTKFRCCPLLRKMVDAGLYGKKSGKGFYNY
jgi:3-hydroxybutyryl-CoA dehydrogenase